MFLLKVILIFLHYCSHVVGCLSGCLFPSLFFVYSLFLVYSLFFFYSCILLLSSSFIAYTKSDATSNKNPLRNVPLPKKDNKDGVDGSHPILLKICSDAACPNRLKFTVFKD